MLWTKLSNGLGKLNILFKASQEDKELDDYIFKTQIGTVINSYAKGIKIIVAWLMILCVFLISLYVITGLSETKPGWNFILQCCYFIVFLIICSLVVQFFTSMILYLIPLSVLATWFITVNI